MNEHPIPYYAVIFSYQRSDSLKGYQAMNEKTLATVEAMDGYLGHDFLENGNGQAVFTSYWRDLEAIDLWRTNHVHLEAKRKGKEQWYKWYDVKICKVERQVNSGF